jgi:glycosyltransferase involved in cell wall biosynthesis
MMILNFSLDNKILDKNSSFAKRAIEYGNLVKKYIVIAPGRKNEKIELSEKVIAYGSGGNNKLMQFFKIYKSAKKLLRDEKFNVITVQDQYYLALIGLCLSKKFKIGLEIQVHGFEKYCGLRKLITKYVLPRANSVRCVSQRLKKQLTIEFSVKEEKVTVVPIYSQLSIVNYPPATQASLLALRAGELRINKNKDKFVFLTVGRFVPVKNIGMQIEAMKEVAKKYPSAELWIIGDGPEKKNYELQITRPPRKSACWRCGQANYKLQKNIKLLGWQDDLNKYYNMADVFVLSSDSEGWGMAVIEAASFGLPIIMTDVGCAREVIKDNESGIIIPVGDRQKLIEAMLKIIEDENLRKKLGENAKLAVSQLLGKEQILDLYKKSWGIALARKL